MDVLTLRERDVIEARSGLRKDVETLASAARRHKRSRQVALNDQKAAIKKMARDGFAAALEARLWAILRGGVLALDDDRAKWLSADAPSEVLLQFVLSHFTTDPARTPCLVDVMGRTYLMPWSQTEFDLQWEKAKARLARLTYPATRVQVRKAIEAGGHGKALGEPLMRCAREALLWGDQERQALAFGTDYAACVLAVLRTCPTPISTQDLHERVGMGDMPAEVMRFAHGVVGLEQHFPDFVRYHKMLVPICVRKVRTEPEREWHSRELYGFLKSKVADLPAWMSFWHITELLRRAPSLRHLGWHSFTLAQRARASAAARIQRDERGVARQARD